jgi:hypothetical protein
MRIKMNVECNEREERGEEVCKIFLTDRNGAKDGESKKMGRTLKLYAPPCGCWPQGQRGQVVPEGWVGFIDLLTALVLSQCFYGDLMQA